MRITITNAGQASWEVAQFLQEEVSKYLCISNVDVEDTFISFDLDLFPDDYAMLILTNMFEGSWLHFWVPAMGFEWIIG